MEKLEEQNTTSLVNNNKKKECSKKQKRRSTTTILKEEDEILGDEDQPLLKKVKSKVESVVEEEKVKIEPALILGDESSPVDEIDGTEGKKPLFYYIVVGQKIKKKFKAKNNS